MTFERIRWRSKSNEKSKKRVRKEPVKSKSEIERAIEQHTTVVANSVLNASPTKCKTILKIYLVYTLTHSHSINVQKKLRSKLNAVVCVCVCMCVCLAMCMVDSGSIGLLMHVSIHLFLAFKLEFSFLYTENCWIL